MGRAGVAVAALIALLAAGCGDPQQIVGSDVMGTNATAGDIGLYSVHLAAPPEPLTSHPPGAEPLAWLTLVNNGRSVDTLTSVSSPYARRVAIYWDRACDGVAEEVPELPLRPTFPDTGAAAAQAAPPFARYHLRLVDLTTELLAGTNVPVDFRFARAGEVRVFAQILPEPLPEPTSRCVPVAGPTAPPA